MKGDISRDTFDPASRFSSVRLQQGRVITDADWNEQSDITRYRAERQAEDIIGDCGAPVHAAGFGLLAATYARAVWVDSGSPSRAWVLGEDGVILRTLHDGATWERSNSDTTAHLRAITFNNNSGWAVGDRGTILKTTTGGDAWAPQSSGTSRSLRGVSVNAAGTVLAVGDSGVILKSTDGNDWGVGTVAQVGLNAVCWADSNQAVAVGQDGEIWLTDDSGANWTRMESKTGSHLRAISVANPTTLYAAGDDGTIIKSTDAGRTWNVLNSGISGHLHAVAFSDNKGWVVGDAGLVWHTNDGGITWTDFSIRTETLRGASLSAGAGWFVGDASTLIRVNSANPPNLEVRSLPSIRLSITPGRLYSHGMLCEFHERASYYHQPDRIDPSVLTPGVHLVYLHAWQRHLSCIEAPEIREVALGGPDTATRIRTVCQIRVLSPAETSPEWDCASTIPEWSELVAPPTSKLRARAEPQLNASNVCELAAAAGYRRIENQLYRVELHEGGAAPSFKWSRENASVAFPIESITPKSDSEPTKKRVRLVSRGKDENLDLTFGERVEILDDAVALEGRVGGLFLYADNGADANEIIIEGVLDAALASDPALHPLLRRWDYKPSTGAIALPIEEGQWIDLEEGVQVWFEPGGTYRPGDYWIIPARTITGDVEWPRDESGQPLSVSPAGVKDFYCRLGIVEVKTNGEMSILSDCRRLFPPLTELDQLLYVSGDGQNGVPGEQLPQDFTVRAARGSLPIEGARVRFVREAGEGMLNGIASSEVTTTTDPDGVATCTYNLDSSLSVKDQRVRACLLDVHGRPLPHQRVEFHATATYWLHYVSGDGQEGSAGQPLAHALEVWVGNGCKPVNGARVKFIADNGVVNPADVLTNNDGFAQTDWTLGSNANQRVKAELLDGPNDSKQYVAFNANLDTQPTATKGCAVTIGDGGQVPKLTTQILKTMLDENQGSLCLCFMPGTHEIDSLVVEFANGRLSMHGCGHASTVKLKGQATFGAFASVKIANLVVNGTSTNALLRFDRCQELVLSELDGTRKPSSNPFLSFQGVDRITVEDCTITVERLAVAFLDAPQLVHFHRNNVAGIVCLYGRTPATTPIPPPWGQLAKHFRDTPNFAELAASGGEFFAAHNHLGLLTVDQEKMAAVAALVQNGPAVKGLFRTISLSENVFDGAASLVLARHVNWDNCLFQNRSVEDFAISISVGAWTAGNDSMLDSPQSAALTLITIREPSKETTNYLRAANGVGIRVS